MFVRDVVNATQNVEYFIYKVSIPFIFRCYNWKIQSSFTRTENSTMTNSQSFEICTDIIV